MSITIGVLKNLRLEIRFKQTIIAELHDTIKQYTADVNHENPQDVFVTAIAANLARFYTGVEDILQDIIKVFDDYKPSGDSWHSSLLAAAVMATDDRPAIINRPTFNMLDDLRGFRHVVYKAYAKPFDWAKMKHLATSVQSSLQAVSDDLAKFDLFLVKAVAAAEQTAQNE